MDPLQNLQASSAMPSNAGEPQPRRDDPTDDGSNESHTQTYPHFPSLFSAMPSPSANIVAPRPRRPSVPLGFLAPPDQSTYLPTNPREEVQLQSLMDPTRPLSEWSTFVFWPLRPFIARCPFAFTVVLDRSLVQLEYISSQQKRDISNLFNQSLNLMYKTSSAQCLTVEQHNLSAEIELKSYLQHFLLDLQSYIGHFGIDHGSITPRPNFVAATVDLYLRGIYHAFIPAAFLQQEQNLLVNREIYGPDLTLGIVLKCAEMLALDMATRVVGCLRTTAAIKLRNALRLRYMDEEAITAVIQEALVYTGDPAAAAGYPSSNPSAGNYDASVA